MNITLAKNKRAGEAQGRCAVEILIKPVSQVTENRHPDKSSPSLYDMKRILGRFKEEPLPEALKAEVLQYLEPEDFEDRQAVLCFEIEASTDWWKEKYGDDIDGNRGQLRTMYGDLRIDKAEGPRPVPTKLRDVFGELLTHEDFDWDSCH